MSADTAFRQLRDANPVPHPASLREQRVDPAAFLAETQQRSRNMQTQDKPVGIEQLEPPRSPRRRWLVPALAGATAVLIAILAIVWISGDDTPDVAPIQTTVPSTTPTTLPPATGPDARPATPVSAVMDETLVAFSSDEYDAALMGVEPGTVTTEWFRAEGFYVVFFEGLDTAATGPTCPGAWLERADGSTFASYAPTEGEDCAAHGPSVRRTSEGARPLVCGNSLAYRTFIPEDAVGTLFGTLTKEVGEGRATMGITSMADSQAGDIPEVDISIFECPTPPPPSAATNHQGQSGHRS